MKRRRQQASPQSAAALRFVGARYRSGSATQEQDFEAALPGLAFGCAARTLCITVADSLGIVRSAGSVETRAPPADFRLVIEANRPGQAPRRSEGAAAEARGEVGLSAACPASLPILRRAEETPVPRSPFLDGPFTSGQGAVG